MADMLPGQLVYLQNCDDRLYGEVIQVIPDRQIVWIRPLLLLEAALNLEPNVLHSVADLLWPMQQFQPALDTDVLPLMPALQDKWASVGVELSPHREELARQRLRRFIERAWQNRCC